MASECYGLLDEVHGLFMTHLSALPAKIGGRDLAMRRTVEKAIYDMRVELSNEATKRANERGEPDEPPKKPDSRTSDPPPSSYALRIATALSQWFNWRKGGDE